MDFYGTIGPSCDDIEILSDMLREGMTGIRVNLSHGDLRGKISSFENLRRAQEITGRKLNILADLIGPELRCKAFDGQIVLEEGTVTELFFCPSEVLDALEEGMEFLMDDGKFLLKTCKDCRRAMVIRGGVLTGRKSITLPDGVLRMPTLTDKDLDNISLFKEYGVSEVMLPFVRDAQDLITLRKALDEAGAGEVRIFAKLENMEGIRALESLLDYADVFVIARGDLGNAMPLWELPAVQKSTAQILRKTQKPFMIVTQMLDSMHHRKVPTRAEVLDIFNAVLDGASSVMLTGETAAGEYPVEAMKYLVKTGSEALSFMKNR